MKSRFLLFLFSLIIPILVFSQNERNFQLGLSNSYFLAGDYSTLYTASLGARFNYVFKKSRDFAFYATSGFSKDLNGDGASLSIVDLGIGTEYQITEVFGNPLVASMAIGGFYYDERFSTQLIENTFVSTFNGVGVLADLGLGYYITERFLMKINALQFDFDNTALGLQAFYNF